MSRRGQVKVFGPTHNRIEVESFAMDDAQVLSIVAAILWASGRETDEQAIEHASKLLTMAAKQIDQKTEMPLQQAAR